jgi:hypothetical protein
MVAHWLHTVRRNLPTPTRSTYVSVTEPLSKERVLAIKNSKTHGQMFFAMGGGHINSNDFFGAQEMKAREDEIAKLEKEKKEQKKYCADQVGAIKMIKAKGELTHTTEKNFNLAEIEMLLKWKKVQLKTKRKREMIDAYIAAPKPKIQKA